MNATGIFSTTTLLRHEGTALFHILDNGDGEVRKGGKIAPGGAFERADFLSERLGKGVEVVTSFGGLFNLGPGGAVEPVNLGDCIPHRTHII